MPTRTRFAPSPTGYMHIGGMRTALFNWLWARHTGGTFILRIDDTDQQRNIEAALDPILDAFRWLGLNWDEGPQVGGNCGPYFQSQRTPLYHDAVARLLAAGHAYRDFEDPAQTQADREAAEKEKRPYLSSRQSLDLSDADRSRLATAGQPSVIRLLVPRDRSVSITDHVRGHVTWDCGLMPDPVILRADGSPLYNLASVVDDIHMHITHVIRAEEHLTNTAVQALLFEALGHPLPEFAHIPFVAAPGTKEKLSKRDKKLEKYRKNPQFKKLFDIADTVLPQIGLGNSETLNPVMVAYYREVGFLPAAALNALARLGWSLDDKTENMSLDFIVENFTLDRVVKAPAGLDPDKLLAYQEHWRNQLTPTEVATACLPYLTRAGRLPDPPSETDRQFVTRLVTALGDRIKLFSDILTYDEYFTPDDQLTYDEKAFDKRLRQPPEAAPLLRKFREELAKADPFTAPHLDQLLHKFVEEQNIPIAQIIHALRIATTGKPTGPGMFDCLELLGQVRCLSRIDRALASL